MTGSSLAFAWIKIGKMAPNGSSLLMVLSVLSLPSEISLGALEISIQHLERRHEDARRLLGSCQSTCEMHIYVVSQYEASLSTAKDTTSLRAFASAIDDTMTLDDPIQWCLLRTFKQTHLLT